MCIVQLLDRRREGKQRESPRQSDRDRKACRFLTGWSLPSDKIPFSLCNEKTAMRARSQALVSHVTVGVHAGELQAGVCASTAHDRVVTTDCVRPSSLSPTQTLTHRGSEWAWLSPGGELTYLRHSVFVSPLAGWCEPGDSVAPAGYMESLFLYAGYCECVFVLYGVVNHWRGGGAFFPMHSRLCSTGRFVREWTWEFLWGGDGCAPAVCIFRKPASSHVFLQLCLSLGTVPRYL